MASGGKATLGTCGRLQTPENMGFGGGGAEPAPFLLEAPWPWLQREDPSGLATACQFMEAGEEAGVGGPKPWHTVGPWGFGQHPPPPLPRTVA